MSLPRNRTRFFPSFGFALACVLLLASACGFAVSIRASGKNHAPPQSTISCLASSPVAVVPPYGPSCEKELFAKCGRPFMFPAHAAIVLGISSALDHSTNLCLWGDNRTSKPVNVGVCCTAFLFAHIDVFDSSGHRMMSAADQSAAKAHGVQTESCTCNILFTVPPHTMEILDPADLSENYALPAGRYTIGERYPPASYNLSAVNQGKSSNHNGLAISLPKPITLFR